MVAGHWSLWTQHAAAGRRRLAAGDWRRAPQTTWWTIDSPRASIRAFRGGSPHGPWALHRGMAPPRKARWLFRSAARRTTATYLSSFLAHTTCFNFRSTPVQPPVLRLKVHSAGPRRCRRHTRAPAIDDAGERGARYEVRGARYEIRKAKGERAQGEMRAVKCEMRHTPDGKKA